MLTIGALNYINALPCFAGFQLGKVPTTANFLYGMPQEINRALALGKIDLGLISSVEYLKNRDRYAQISNHGIAAIDRVMSVNLYHRGTVQELDGKTIGVTNHSATSVELLRVLCERFWKISCTLEVFSSLDEAKKQEAFILIGDPCLQNQNIDGFTTLDLAQAWYEATNSPFVFAVFAARHETLEKKGELIKEFQQQLKKSLEWAQKNKYEIEAIAERRCTLSIEQIRCYLSLLKHSFTSDILDGLNMFDQLIMPIGVHT